MKEYFFEKRGICYRTNEFQVGRKTLVWIHGLSGSASAWFPYERFFSEKYNLLTFDLRGHGNSDRPRHYRDYEMRKNADDIYELLNYLDIDSCILISHSFGALIALEFANTHKDRVSSLIFLSPAAFLESRWVARVVRIISSSVIALCSATPFRSNLRGRVDYLRFTNTGDWDLVRIFRDIRNTSVHSYLYCFFQAYATNHGEEWSAISVPTLIIHGQNDSFVPIKYSVRLAEEIPKSELVRLKSANHIIVLNNIAEVSENIERFLASVRSQSL